MTADLTVGADVYFWPARDHVAKIVEAEQNPLTGKWRYKIEYVGTVTGAGTVQWVGASAFGVNW